jgi:hypothetical protein
MRHTAMHYYEQVYHSAMEGRNQWYGARHKGSHLQRHHIVFKNNLFRQKIRADSRLIVSAEHPLDITIHE